MQFSAVRNTAAQKQKQLLENKIILTCVWLYNWSTTAFHFHANGFCSE